MGDKKKTIKKKTSVAQEKPLNEQCVVISDRKK